ncbi:MAG TPA: hypothetical protein VFA41_05400 [Ktedonobacteraceae bacterium]|jgi:hypothetical protein|nr:hypothetical protein [Ktedonobacteraceae bacterium]
MADNQQKQPDPKTLEAERFQEHEEQGKLNAQEEHDPMYGGKGDEGQHPDEPVEQDYSYLGPHDGAPVNEVNTAPDGYGLQDQFGDVDGQDPFTNLDEAEEKGEEEEPDESAGGDGTYDLDDTLYGLAEPLAKPGDLNRRESERDLFGTRRSQDQDGYQQ